MQNAIGKHLSTVSRSLSELLWKDKLDLTERPNNRVDSHYFQFTRFRCQNINNMNTTIARD